MLKLHIFTWVCRVKLKKSIQLKNNNQFFGGEESWRISKPLKNQSRFFSDRRENFADLDPNFMVFFCPNQSDSMKTNAADVNYDIKS